MSGALIEEEYSLEGSRQGGRCLSEGFSELACNLFELIEKALDEHKESFFRKEKIGQIIYELSITYSNSLSGNVDNYGGEPGNVFSYREAYEFILLLPEELLEIPPTVLLEPDGSFELDWENENTGYSFAISFSGKAEIFFAGLFSDGAKIKGVEFFDKFWLPSSIKACVLRVIKEK